MTGSRAGAVGAVLVAAIAFGTTGTAQARGPAGTTPLGVGAMRILVGAAGLVAVAAWQHRRDGGHRWPARAHLARTMIGGVGIAVYQPAFFAGTERSGVAIGTIVALGSGPAFVGIWEALAERRRPGRNWAFATALALAGGALIVAAQAGDGGGRVDAVGIACSLGAGAGYATYALAARSLIAAPTGERVPSATVMAWIFSVGAILLSPAWFVEPLGWMGTARGALMAAHLGLVTVTVAYLLFGIGLRVLPTSTATTLTLAEPVTAAVCGVVLLGERLAPLGWAGAALVIAALALTGRSGDRMPVSARRAASPSP